MRLTNYMRLSSIKIFRRVLISLIIISIIIVISIFIIDRSVTRKTADHIYTDVNKLPPCDVAVLLGTSHYFSNGNTNQYFTYRIKAAAEYFNGR